MGATRDDFEHWLFEMDDRLGDLVNALPADVSAKMDYSADSLSLLEGWLLENYRSSDDILQEPHKRTLDMLARYVGETFRKALGGIWSIDLENRRSVYYRMPVVEKSGCWVECPLSLVTASVDRRTGRFMVGVLNSIAARYGVG